MRRLAITLLVLGGVVVSAVPVRAGALDPNDTPGRLDISGAAIFRSASGGITYIDVHTYANWHPGLIAHSTSSRFFVLFDVDNDGVRDYLGTVQSSHGRLYITIRGSGQSFEPIRAGHPADDRLRVVLPGDSPPNPLTTWQVAFRSLLVTAGGPCTSPCRDRAPDMGWWTVPAA